jgi:hypothetical protein
MMILATSWASSWVSFSTSLVDAQEYLTGIEWPEPAIVTPGKTDAAPPSDAIVLFDGKDLSAWNGGNRWRIEEGVATAAGGDIVSKQTFGDIQLHVEWSAPIPQAGRRGQLPTSQGRSNSGVFPNDGYELQILDSYDNKTYFDGQAGAIYKQTPPMVNAMRPPGEWNSYDIIWTAPVFNDDGTVKSPANMTAIHNGVLIVNNFSLLGTTPFNTPPKYEKHGKLPIRIQFHGNPVRFRNIWVREIKPIEGTRARPPYMKNRDQETPVEPVPPLPANSK